MTAKGNCPVKSRSNNLSKRFFREYMMSSEHVECCSTPLTIRPVRIKNHDEGPLHTHLGWLPLKQQENPERTKRW